MHLVQAGTVKKATGWTSSRGRACDKEGGNYWFCNSWLEYVKVLRGSIFASKAEVI